MRVILQEKVAKLGKVGDQVTVKRGYGRNFLIPQGKAVMATPENIEVFERNRAELEKRAAEVLAQAQARFEKLADLVVTIMAQAGEGGKLFGSVGARDVADAVTAAGVELEKSEVRLPEGPIRQTGEFEIGVYLHSEVTGNIKVVVSPE